MNKATQTVDDYIATFSEQAQERLHLIRQLIKDNAPEATESIGYGLAAYKMNKKPLVYFGGFTAHTGFYATPVGHEQFKDKLSGYKQGKGSVQFPHSQPLPVDLIVEMVKFRLTETA